MKRFAHVDFIRALAVLFVVVQHAGLENGLLGSAGVTMFFVVSGFVITHGALTEYRQTGSFRIGKFYQRRALKLLPPLALVILIPSMIAALVSAWHLVKPVPLASQLLFFYNYVRIGGQGGVLPGTDVIWSLSVEEQFYIGFALLWLVCLKLPNPRLALTWLAAAAFLWATTIRLVFAYFGSQTLAQQLYFSTPTRIDAIALGVLTALLLSSNSWRRTQVELSGVMSSALLFASGSLLCASLLMQNYEANYSWMISLHALVAAAIIVAGFGPNSLFNNALLRASGWRWLNRIGLASYSIYLLHHMVSLLLSPMLVSLPLPLQWAIKALAGVLAGLALWRLVEIPVEEFKRRRLNAEWRGAVPVR